MPAVLTEKGTPKLIPELAILKRDMSVKDAATVGENDLEIMALQPRALALDQKKESALADEAD